MLKNIQIKIVLIFLVIGILSIGIMGYVNYSNLNIPQDSNVDSSLILNNYKTNLKTVVITTISIFTLICILARSFYK